MQPTANLSKPEYYQVALWFHDPKAPGSILAAFRLYLSFLQLKTKSSQILSSNNPVYYPDAHNKIEQFRYTIVSVTLDIIMWVTVPLQEQQRKTKVAVK